MQQRRNSILMSRVVISLIISLLFVSSTATAQLFPKATAVKSTSIVNIGSQSYYVHTVKSGETVTALARLYDVSQGEITKNNPQTVDGLQVGQVLKIPVNVQEPTKREQKAAAKLFTKHTVNAGETAYSIAKRYGISVPMLVEDNPGVDITQLSIGQQLNVRKSAMGESTDAQIKEQLEDYKDKLNSVSTDYIYHMVEKGETVYSLSKRFAVAQEVLVELNQLELGLKLGSVIKIPVQQPTVKDSVTVAVQSVEIENLGRRATEDAVIKSTFGRTKSLNVAMLLPLKGTSASKSFVEFYQGALLALEQLKAKGISLELNLYNTSRSQTEVESIVSQRGFDDTDLIIGPVYEESLSPVLDFARKNHVAVVSPLASVEQQQSPYLYQLSPDATNKYDKMRDFLSPQKNVVVISSANNDAEFEREITAQLPHGYRRFSYSRGVAATEIENLISGDKDNVFVVLSSNEYTVDEILARISSVQNNLVARSIKNANIAVVGSSKWTRFVNIDKNLFFKLGLCFVTSYHADRTNERVAAFDKRYITAYGALPTLYSYRGYDATKLFVETMTRPGNDFTAKLNNPDVELLQMPYRFKHAQRGDNNKNDQWALVVYSPDYNVTVR